MKYITQRTCGVSWILGWCNSTPYLEADVFSDQSALWAISRKPINELMIDVNKPVRPGKSQFSKDFELLSGFKVQYDHGRCRVGFWREEIWRQNLHFTSAMFLLHSVTAGRDTRTQRMLCPFHMASRKFLFYQLCEQFTNHFKSELDRQRFFSK